MASIPLTTKSINSTTFINAFDICNGRLTLTSNTPVTTTDITGAGTLYWTPYKGSYVAIYNGSQWLTYQFSQLSITLASLAINCYDVFVSVSGSVPVLSLLAWTNTTTRSINLVLLNGVYVQNGTSTNRYLGTIYISATGVTSDALAGRYVWNYYNRIQRSLSFLITTTVWSLVSGTSIRNANGSSAYALNFVSGISEDIINASISIGVYQQNTNLTQYYMGFGTTTTAYSNNSLVGLCSPSYGGGVIIQCIAQYHSLPSIGVNNLYWLESTNGGGGQVNIQTSNAIYSDGIMGYFLM